MKERGTNAGSTVERILTAVALATGLFFANVFFAGSMMHAQNAIENSQTSASQQQDHSAAPTDQTSDDPTEQKTFTGVIARSGDKLVLTDPLTKTSYQLDDQRKAQELVNKNVKVTGVLDPSTGTIRVAAIEPL